MEPGLARGRRTPRTVAGIRVGVGVWLLAVTTILCADGYWLGLVILVPAALHFWLAYRALHPRQG
jgi:hypothetical protein